MFRVINVLPKEKEVLIMTANYNRKGAERKELVKAIESIENMKVVYKGAPGFEYVVNNFIIDKNGSVSCKDEKALEDLIHKLTLEGFECEHDEAPLTDHAEETADALTIEMPREKLTDEAIENLKKITESKAGLFKKAFETDELPIDVSDEKVSFPWFRLADAEAVKAYTHFISAICEMATTQKRITATEKEVDNDKYAFRCFLLRLGFIGAEYKAERKVLLKNLTGSSAFKSGKKGGAE